MRCAFRGSSILWAAVFLALAGCRAGVFVHDEHTAAKSAEAFAQAAFVERDFPRAYAQLAPALRAERTEAAFTEIVRTMHPLAWPSSVRASSFEPVPGTATMQVYLEGRAAGSEEAFFYRLLMQGSAPGGYQPAGLFRRDAPYPSSGLRRPL